MDLLSSLKTFFKVDSTTIDNNIFRLHYKATAVILVGFSILVTGRQYLGDPIDCIKTNEKIPGKMLDTYCWTHTTFSMLYAFDKPVGIDGVIYPGVAQSKKGEPKKYHAYYQWVSFVLFFQAILFYLPRYFWTCMERNRVKNLTFNLDLPAVDEESKTKNKNLLVNYLLSNINNHNMYFACYLLAEIMNFVNVVGQMFLMDKFLGWEFSTYGSDVLKFTEWDNQELRPDPMLKIFPRMAKCTPFHLTGFGGDAENTDALCLLPINIINEKIYIFLWFWFIILATLSAFVLVYRIILIFRVEVRIMSIRSRNQMVEPHCLDTVVRKSSLGDWLILDLLSKNLDSVNYRDVLTDFSNQLEKNYDFVMR